MDMRLILFLIATVFCIINCFYRIKFFLHMMQLDTYHNDKYLKWLNDFKNKAFTKKAKVYLIISIVATVIFLLLPIQVKSSAIFYFISLWIILPLATIELKKDEAKKPLVFTQRAKRLFALSLSVFILEIIITIFLVNILSKNFMLYNPVILGIYGILIYFSPYYIVVGNYLAKPIEKRINGKYYNMAYNKVRNIEGLTTVGITGSYGKTSTKFITAKIIEQKYNTLKTPESYNTPMGISKVINNTLNDSYEIFVSELGAERVGEIEEIAKLTNPKIGVITSIGMCHLETFKSIDNIMRTKYELIEALPNDGIAIFNYDNENVRKLADKTFKEKILYGIDYFEDVDIFATDIKVNEKGSSFTLCDKDRGTIECETKLLGKHNILNILAGAAVGKALGLSLYEIAQGIEKVEPVEHRLQLINPGTGILVIDDAFNSNPDGAKAALEVLSNFTEGRKIIVTPGMIELGQNEEKENEIFGENIAKTCDYAILVGKKRTEPIYKGLQNYNFDKEKIIIVNSLEEVNKIIPQIAKPKDVILFENDLPDTYNE